MKICAFKYCCFVILLSMILTCLDILLILCCGLEKEFLLFIYVIIGIIPLCGIVSLTIGMVPKIIFDKESKTIITFSIPDERYMINKLTRNTGTIIHFDEINDCFIEKNKIIITMGYGQNKTLYLNLFTNCQILKIKREIDNIKSL